MKYVMKDLHKQKQQDLPVIRLKIDYELMTLYDAIQAKDHVQIVRSKERLEQLRLKWLAFDHEALH